MSTRLSDMEAEALRRLFVRAVSDFDLGPIEEFWKAEPALKAALDALPDEELLKNLSAEWRAAIEGIIQSTKSAADRWDTKKLTGITPRD